MQRLIYSRYISLYLIHGLFRNLKVAVVYFDRYPG